MKENKLSFGKFSLTGKISLVCIFIIIFLVTIAPFLDLHPHNLPSGKSLEPPSREHLLGTDDLGIDILSQILYGGKISLIIGLSTAFGSVLLGCFLGVLAGYIGGLVDMIIMRITDVMLALPSLPLMILIASYIGPGLKNIVIILTLFSWTSIARLARSKIIHLKEEDYVKIAKSYGANFFYLLKEHFFVELYPILAVSVMGIVGRAIVSEASLSFLGLGDPTSKSWGLILNYSINFRGIYFTDYWKWWVISPLAGIILLITSISVVGKDLERHFNKKL